MGRETEKQSWPFCKKAHAPTAGLSYKQSPNHKLENFNALRPSSSVRCCGLA
jgi:hypothetical protein